MSRLRVLFITHNHPSLHPGGSEIFAHDLFRSMQASGEVDAMFLACTNRLHREPKPGSAFQAIGRNSDEVLLWAGHFDHFNLSQVDLHGVVPELTAFLEDFRPDIVHFHHALLIGAETIFLVRRVLPNARIVFTLHDYYAICANHGQMVTASEHALCGEASPDGCHKCFPEIGADRFVLRQQHLLNLFGLVDQFISPSAFLKERYIAWGLDGRRIAVLANGRPAVAPAAHRNSERRTVFGFFGNLSPFKGVAVAVAAVRQLTAAGARGVRLRIHGNSLFQSEAFKHGLDADIAAAAPYVTHHGGYKAADLPGLMAEVDWVVVPSIWWENAPLVIQEAFQHRRPVICSDIGGMAEMVQHDVCGLHFRAGDATSLAQVMRRAVSEPDLWPRMVTRIPEVPTVPMVAEHHAALYRELMRRPLRVAA
jgi:glycosyltransferase involved in cell wall biosynthesis